MAGAEGETFFPRGRALIFAPSYPGVNRSLRRFKSRSVLEHNSNCAPLKIKNITYGESAHDGVAEASCQFDGTLH